MSICSQIDSCVLATACAVLSEFQTLFTGFAAIGVAIVAGIPVWRQLKDSNLQTRISHRETLQNLLRDALRRHERVDSEMKKPLSMAIDVTSDPEGQPIEIEPEDANGIENMFSGLISWYLVVLKDTEQGDIEAAKTILKDALEKAVETLGDAHWADHNYQDDPDHVDIPAAEWAKIVDRCAEAKIEASARVGEVDTAYRALQEVQRNWVRSLRAQIARLDTEIASPR